MSDQPSTPSQTPESGAPRIPRKQAPTTMPQPAHSPDKHAIGWYYCKVCKRDQPPEAFHSKQARPGTIIYTLLCEDCRAHFRHHMKNHHARRKMGYIKPKNSPEYNRHQKRVKLNIEVYDYEMEEVETFFRALYAKRISGTTLDPTTLATGSAIPVSAREPETPLPQEAPRTKRAPADPAQTSRPRVAADRPRKAQTPVREIEPYLPTESAADSLDFSLADKPEDHDPFLEQYKDWTPPDDDDDEIDSDPEYDGDD